MTQAASKAPAVRGKAGGTAAATGQQDTALPLQPNQATEESVCGARLDVLMLTASGDDGVIKVRGLGKVTSLYMPLGGI